MLSSFSMVRVGVLLATVGIGMLTPSCRSSNQAFVQYQRPVHAHESPPERLILAPPDTLPTASDLRELGLLTENQQLTSQLGLYTSHHPKLTHIKNPESRESNRKSWLQRLNVNNDPTTAEYTPRREVPVLSTKRKIPGIVKASLAGGILSQGLLLLGMASGTIWILAITLPLASVLLGIAGLAKISRQREEYRGKGWAMSAIMLATGALGLALVAAAALATSETIWK